MADTLTPEITTDRATVYRSTWRELAATLPDNMPGASLAIVDGPYNMKKADWDTFRDWDHFVAWYRPELEELTRVLDTSANVYLWGTDTSASELRPLMAELGWRRRTRVIWDKGIGFMAGKIDTAAMTNHYDLTEVCDHYQRNAWDLSGGAGQEIAHAAGADDRNWIRPWIRAEWMEEAGLRSGEADKALGTNGMAGHYFGASQWSLPTWKHFQTLHRYAQEHGPARERPYLVLPQFADLRATYDHLRAEYDHLRAEYDHLRAEYEASRAPFNHPQGVGNVWRSPTVSGAERLSGPDGSLHPCQKPLAFYDRLIRSSSRPGDTVLEPYGGTLRAAVACHRLPPSESRHAIVCEPHGPYIEAVRPSLEWVPPTVDGLGLFG